MDISKVYKNLTNVDIDTQKELWDERGKGYYGEFLVFNELFCHMSGTGKILMNLNIPVSPTKTTEIDLLLIHETGVYVFEIKHYKGTIYGKDTDPHWTQYFRTAKNNVFANPVNQNHYHIEALRKLITDRPLHSVVVFTNSDCDLRITQSKPELDICLLRNIPSVLHERFQKQRYLCTTDDIEKTFEQLLPYSQMQEEVVIDGDTAPFSEWLSFAIDSVDQEKERLIALQTETQKSRKRNLLLCILIMFLSIVAAGLLVLGIHRGYQAAINKNNIEISEFKQNFYRVEDLDDPYVDLAQTVTTISNVQIREKSKTVTSFSARITIQDDAYGIMFTENSKYIVMTKQGTVYEYDMFGDHLLYRAISNKIGKGYRTYGDLKTIDFLGVSKQDITYVKVTDVILFTADLPQTELATNLDLELYAK